MPEVSNFIQKDGTVFILKDANARVQIQSISDIIAPVYDDTYEYSMGDFTIYNNKMYYCIANTTGEFDSSKWKAVSLASRIKDIESGEGDTTYTLIQSPEDPNTLIFTPSRGTDPTTITIPKTVYKDATQSASGLLSATDKSKLDGIDISADVNKIESIKINNVTQPIVDKSVDIIIPTATSDLTNDSSYQTSTEVSDAINNAIDNLDVESVGGAGKYIQSISETNGKISAITADLPAVNNGTLTIQKNGTNIQTFSANQSSNVIADITVPTKLSDLENDIDLTGNIDLSEYSKTNHKHTKSDITDFPTSMPASDVSAWAKAATKPTYTASEVGAAASDHNHDTVYAAKNHGNHVPATQTANNAVFLRNDNTWQTVTPTNIGAATSTQGSKADTAVQSVKISGSNTELKNGTSVTLPAYPTTLPASDVSAWAKAATKPTYTASEVGLSDVGNFKAVSTVANQGLTDTEKANARTNIGAGTSNFSGSYNDLLDKPANSGSNLYEEDFPSKTYTRMVAKPYIFKGLQGINGEYIWNSQHKTYMTTNASPYFAELDPITGYFNTISIKYENGTIPSYSYFNNSHRFMTPDGYVIIMANSTTGYVFDEDTNILHPITITGRSHPGYSSCYNIWTDFSGHMYYSDGRNYYEFTYNYNTKTLTISTQQTYSSGIYIYGYSIWKDPVRQKIYHSYSSYQYEYDETTKTWTAITWNGQNRLNAGSSSAKYIKNYGNDIYYKNSSSIYYLDRSTNTWIAKTFANIDYDKWEANHVWYDVVNNKTCLCYPTYEYQMSYNPTTKEWEPDAWYYDQLKTTYSLTRYIFKDHLNNIYYVGEQGQRRRSFKLVGNSWLHANIITPTNVDPSYIWNDGSHTYSSSGTNHFEFDIETYQFTAKTWKGLTEFSAGSTWHDFNGNVYYSAASNQYVLDKSTSTWNPKTWNGLTSFSGSNIWNDGIDIYVFANNIFYKLIDNNTWVATDIEVPPCYGFNVSNIWYDINNTPHYNFYQQAYITANNVNAWQVTYDSTSQRYANDQYTFDCNEHKWVEQTIAGDLKYTKFKGNLVFNDSTGKPYFVVYYDTSYTLMKTADYYCATFETIIENGYNANDYIVLYDGIIPYNDKKMTQLIFSESLIHFEKIKIQINIKDAVDKSLPSPERTNSNITYPPIEYTYNDLCLAFNNTIEELNKQNRSNASVVLVNQQVLFTTDIVGSGKVDNTTYYTDGNIYYRDAFSDPTTSTNQLILICKSPVYESRNIENFYNSVYTIPRDYALTGGNIVSITIYGINRRST